MGGRPLGRGSVMARHTYWWRGTKEGDPRVAGWRLLRCAAQRLCPGSPERAQERLPLLVAVLWPAVAALLLLVAACHPLSPTTTPATPSAGPAALPTPTASQGPAPAGPASPTPTSSPLQLLAQDLNLLLLGSDHRLAEDPTWRTDTIIVVAVRPQLGLVAMLSIPRDLWVNIPGHGYNRINVADYLGERAGGRGGGSALLAATLKENLGITIDATAYIDLQGLARIVDNLGGIVITSDRAFDEWFWDETAPGGVSHMVVVPGPQRMDGRLAVQYARSRQGTNDMDRSRRQQQVLLAIRDAALRPEVLPRLPALISALSDAVDTDLRPTHALLLVGLALRLGPASYRGRVFDHTMVTDWTTPGGAQVLLPNHERIAQVWAELTGDERP